jgi:Ion channel
VHVPPAGNLYPYAYGVVAELSSESFFAETSATTISDFLYFSFTTMSTTGFGDLTAATDTGPALAVTEELAGQIYLVTVVAVIVSNLGRGRPSRGRSAG